MTLRKGRTFRKGGKSGGPKGLSSAAFLFGRPATVRSRFAFGAMFFVLGILQSCSSGQIDPLQELPKPPAYTEVPHPGGLEYADLLSIFTDPQAPTPDSLANCDSDFQKLRKATLSRDELQDGVREMVKADPSKYHWCYYSKVFLLDKKLKEMTYIDEKQKLIIDTFLFLTPMARAFQSEFQDSRYYRWAVGRYRRYSEMAFYRRVEPTATANAELAGAVSPMGSQRMVPLDSERSILEKYGIANPTPTAPIAGGASVAKEDPVVAGATPGSSAPVIKKDSMNEIPAAPAMAGGIPEAPSFTLPDEIPAQPAPQRRPASMAPAVVAPIAPAVSGRAAPVAPMTAPMTTK